MIHLDRWQKEILETKGNLLVCSGRQMGKSTIISIKASKFACENGNKSILIVSSTERQAEELFLKCLDYIEINYKRLIKRGRERPTKSVLRLTNGSIIRSLPTGSTGSGIRGFTISMLIVDECAFVQDEIFSAITPMLLTTGGDIILVSTPHGRFGYFWECYNNPDFKVFHVDSEKAILEREISSTWSETQRENAIKHLESEKKRMSAREFAQEYKGQFVDDLIQWFSDDLIKKCMVLKRSGVIHNDWKKYYLGVDVARLGKDLCVFSIIDGTNKDNILHIDSIIQTKKRLNETYNKILQLDRSYNFKSILIDDGGIGVSIFDFCLENPQTRKKIVAVNNRARPLDKEEQHKKKLLKEDLYNNMLMLMEQGRLKLLDDDEVFLSLKSVQYEYVTKENALTKLRIFGDNTHLCESLIRACWGIKEKHLNVWCAYSK